MNNTTEQPILHEYLGLAQQAHRNTSFTPDKRGKSVIEGHSADLMADLEELAEAGADTDTLQQYITKYKKLFREWMHAKSRCISSMITGPANFPTRRAEKYNKWEHNKMEKLYSWQERAKAAIKRKLEPPVTFESEIDRLSDELQSLKKSHTLMKNVNKIIRKANGDDCTAQLIAAGLPEKHAKEIQQPDCMGQVGFAGYALSNNRANIKRIESRIAELSQKQERAKQEPHEIPFQLGTIVLNYEIDRLQLLFNDKPSKETRTHLKKNGFRWAPSETAWQRKLTRNARHKAARLTGVNVPIN
jgi:hypothetical protein